MFRKVLVANRGEIALRVIRACRELGLSSVAVHSDADDNSLHRRFADEDVCIGPARARDSYLNIASILSAAEITGADAVHPGYGFLAENSRFAQQCKEHGLTFIGPTPDQIESMGNKVKAREIMIKAGVPCVPGTGSHVDVGAAQKDAEKIGYPVLIKASAGGGGRGIRIVRNKDEFRAAFIASKTEAEAAFSSGDLYIEKYIVDPRHIEVQIIADNFGNVLHLGERDCSIQRRHQKLIEEAPAINLPPEKRTLITAAAIKAAKAVSYQNAGTVEFILDTKTNNFYFIEMNTRIQVEHPVTEQITGINIIKEQIRLAQGEALRFKQKDVAFRGHSIECRINAEDPRKNFRPSPGRITHLHEPGGFGVRVDSHIYADYEIPTQYDSMIGKLIVWGEDRNDAISRMHRCLDEYVIEGISTTIPFHKVMTRSDAYRSGKVHVNLADKINLEKEVDPQK